ncbi:hypothetical protein KP509_30G007600 [Ceratopteris richardii]|uniref:Uncharacterized protein n=1 Tax=Ceratopteris richardii TaxID=49495 RepID=A0A8T2QZT6_CERRI|nr:hypothetical protein KP509_30G007600 [Ceratopteris richardii]
MISHTLWGELGTSIFFFVLSNYSLQRYCCSSYLFAETHCCSEHLVSMGSSHEALSMLFSRKADQFPPASLCMELHFGGLIFSRRLSQFKLRIIIFVLHARICDIFHPYWQTSYAVTWYNVLFVGPRALCLGARSPQIL